MKITELSGDGHVLYEVEGDIMVVHLPSEVDDFSSRSIKEETERIMKKKEIRKIIFDFSKTEFMDSSGIGVLLGRYKRMQEVGGKVFIYGADRRVKRILAISGIYQVMESIN